MAGKPGPRTSATPPNPKDSPWLSVRQAATYLGVSVDSIYDACAEKGLRHAKLGYATIRLKREWLDQWAESLARSYTKS